MKSLPLSKKTFFIILGLVLLVGVVFFVNKAIDEKAINVKPDYSGNGSIQNQDKNVIIDFGTCTQDKKRIGAALGSITIAIFGKSQDSCVMRFGGEVENPNWDGTLPTKCTIPLEKGIMEFTKTNYGVDFQDIQQYCSK